jgi:predicted  nucleic acid-binding Zn-ribbon protein
MGIRERLLTVQEFDLRIRAMERELRDIPVRQARERTRLDEHRARLAAAEERLKGKQAGIKKLDLESESQREKIDKFRRQQLELKTNKEFKAMESEIRNVEQEIGGIEDKELVLMEDVEQARADVRTLTAELGEANTQVERSVRELDERVKGMEQELGELREKRAAAAKEVDRGWLVQYERVFERKDNAFVALTDGICGGCHMKLPPAVAHATKKEEVVTCPYCRRMLY